MVGVEFGLRLMLFCGDLFWWQNTLSSRVIKAILCERNYNREIFRRKSFGWHYFEKRRRIFSYLFFMREKEREIWMTFPNLSKGKGITFDLDLAGNSVSIYFE